MSTSLVILSAILYITFIFITAIYADKQAERGIRLVNNPYVYAFSLAVFCTAWTFFGSVGQAATSGIGFLATYLGPTLFAPLWVMILHKVIVISKHQRITSIADFISSRYGKSTALGIVATLIAVIGIVPYISIQLKAISIGFDILTIKEDGVGSWLNSSIFFRDPGFWVAVVLTIFIILFGTRKLDVNEQHEGLTVVIAVESVIKLLAFLLVGIFVTYGIYDGFGDIFTQAAQFPELQSLMVWEEDNTDGFAWFFYLLLAMLAILLLPRQFHMAVVENTNPDFVRKAAYLFPLYLLLINLFVLPIAFGGVMHFRETGIEPDSFVLNLPLIYDYQFLALIVFLGGFAAASGMVIVSVNALSIMISNNLVTPFLLATVIREKVDTTPDISQRLLGIRRVSMAVVMILAYGYFQSVSTEYSLVSIGIISFAAVAQFAPAVIGGIYWTRATKAGALAGLLTGFMIWLYTLPLPISAEVGMFSTDFVEHGLGGYTALRPYELLGLTGMDRVAHAAFWSLLFNITAYVGVSLYTRPSALEISQADLFVNIYRYKEQLGDLDTYHREANLTEVTDLLYRFVGDERAQQLICDYETLHQIELAQSPVASTDFINFVETQLTGILGAASAKVVIGSVVKENPISMEEMFKIIEETQEIVQYSKALETKSNELEQTTRQLQNANKQLKELDKLKANFITTVTHELRTPITSIRSLAKILADNQGLSLKKREQFLDIIVRESERISRLINQVLDLERIQSLKENWILQPLDLNDLVEKTYLGFVQAMDEKQIKHQLQLPANALWVKGNADKLTQVLVNLFGNALKFTSPADKIYCTVQAVEHSVLIQVKDTGIGIPEHQQQLIFQRFTQINDRTRGKPKGSGLGLFISKTIIERHGGKIEVQSQPQQGTTFTVTLPQFNS